MEARKITYYELTTILENHALWNQNSTIGKKACFRGLDLTEHQLAFTGISFYDVDFSYANLSGIDFCGCNLDDANFTGANLSNTHLCGAWLMGAKVKDADFTNADFYKAWVSGTHWKEALNLDKSVNFGKVRLADWNRHPDFDKLTIQEQIRVLEDAIIK